MTIYQLLFKDGIQELRWKAIAEILFGDYSPEGKLPVTFYRTTEELPDFTDYNMANEPTVI